MDRKGRKTIHSHAERKRKRHFHGNQHTAEQNTEFASTSAQKLRSSENIDCTISRESGYCVLNFFTVFSTIASYMICKNCKSEIKFSQTAR